MNKLKKRKIIFLIGLSATVAIIAISGCLEQGTALRAENAYARKTSKEEWQEIKTDARFVVSPEFGVPKNIGGPVNSPGWEDSPNISADGKTLLFAYVPFDVISSEKERRAVISGPFRGLEPEDYVPHIYVSTLDADGKWSEPKLLAFSRANYGDGGPQLSFNGEKIYFMSRTAQRAADLFYSERIDGWKTRKKMMSPPNSDYAEEDPAISRDEDEIIFWSSDRPGGLGGPDLYSSKKINGKWQKAINLKTVNSPAVDYQPFLSWDGKELYFTSSRNGIVAIYRSSRSEAGEWREPELVMKADPATGVVGVGEPTLTADGRYLYFIAGYVSSYGEYDADILYVERINEVKR